MELILQPLSGVPAPHDTRWVDEVLATIHGEAGSLVARGFSMSREGLDGALLTLWEGAGTETASGGVVTLGRGRRYQVTRHSETAMPRPSRYVQLTTFDGPRDQTWAAAFERSAAERVWPALREVPGITASLLCVAEDGGALAVTLAVSVEALEAGLEAVMATDLMPGEDPDLLTGPDHVDVYRLVRDRLPSLTPGPHTPGAESHGA